MTDPSRPAAADVLACRFGNTLPEVGRAVQEVLAFLGERGLGEQATHEVNLVVEELATNIVKYGYDDEGPHTIELTVALGPDSVEVVLEDDGHEFDPLAAPPPHAGVPLAERPVGGLGIALVRRFARSMRYERQPGRNRLTVVLGRA